MAPNRLNIVPRDNSINTTPLVVIPMLCVAIFALIIYYTFKQEREDQNDISSGRRPTRSVTSRQVTGAWVREVRSGARTQNMKKGQASGKETRIGTGGARNSKVTTTEEGRLGAGLEMDGNRLSTIEEDAESDVEKGRAGAGGARGSPKKSPLKGGRRPSSTIRPV